MNRVITPDELKAHEVAESYEKYCFRFFDILKNCLSDEYVELSPGMRPLIYQMADRIIYGVQNTFAIFFYLRRAQFYRSGHAESLDY